MSRVHVAVVGAGIGGLAAANALSRRGIDVTVYEQARYLGEVSAGICLSRNSLRLLERLGLGDQIREVTSAIAEVRLHDALGELVSTQSPHCGLRGVDRHDLVGMLAGNLMDGTVITDSRCVEFRQSDDHATLTFDNGHRAVADVVIAADGIHSALQRHVVPAMEPVYSGSMVYRGVMARSHLPDYPSDKGTMWMGEGRHFIMFPMRGGELFSYTGFVPSDNEVRECWSAPGEPAALAAEFEGWDPELGRVLGAVTSTLRWGLYDREPLPRWTAGRLTLLGDAAHPMPPHLGGGANQAIEDAFALATLLSGLGSDSAPQALQQYEILRSSRTAEIQLGSRVNGLLFDRADFSDPDSKIANMFSDLQSSFDYDVEAVAGVLR